MRLALITAALLASAPLQAAPRSAHSGPERHALLELFTSEGCSSCPPVDAWLSESVAQLAAHRVVPLALHVDYSDDLGWPDPFAQPAFTRRQRQAAERAGGEVYTPELMLDGRQVHRPDVLAARGNEPAHAQLTLTADVADGRIHARLQVDAADRPLRLYLAVVSNGLCVDVPRGENGGKHLCHDAVARTVVGPVAAKTLERDLPLPRDGTPGLVAFAEDASGAVVQAVSLPLDR